MQNPANLLFSVLLIISWNSFAQKPRVVSSDRKHGAMKEIVTIKGSDFGTDPTKIKVFFGAAAAEIKKVSNQLIQVIAPPGTTHDNISVTNLTTGLAGYDPSQFFLSFMGGTGISAQNFSPQTDFNAETGLYDLCLCDFNGDGKVDIATASTASNSLTIFQNNSTLSNLVFAPTNFLINTRSLHVICGDLNGDGHPDIAVSENDGDRLFIFKNNGGFAFTIQSIKLTGKRLKRVAIADLDLDGKPEVIITDKGSNIITLLPNLSTFTDITFNTPVDITIPGIASTDALEVKDLNGNGLPEIITSQFNTTTNIFICENKSTAGIFNFSDITTLTVNSIVVNIKAGDLDGDGKPDLAATRLLGSDMIVFLNQSTGTQFGFSALTSIQTGTRPWGLDLGDLDGDGKIDIVVASIDAINKGITVLNNQSTAGSLSFKPMLTLASTFINRHVKIGDMNGDGKPDINLASIDDNNLGISASRISVFRNKSCFVPGVQPIGPLTICTGFPLRLNAAFGGGVNYNWKKNNTTVSNGPDPFLNIIASGDYTVTAESEAGSCAKISNTVKINVEVGGSLSATDPMARSNSPVCTNGTLNLQVTDIGATQYRWRGPMGFTATGLTPSLPNFTLDNAGLYIVEMIVGTCVAKSDSTIVEGIRNPDFSVIYGGSGLICQGSSKVLSVSPVIATGFTYQWLEKIQGPLAGQTNTTYSATASGEYFVRVISSNPGCNPIETPAVKLTVVSLPVAAFTPSATSACVGQQITFTNQSIFDPKTIPVYTWTFGDTKSSTEVSPVYKYSRAAIFQVKLRVAYPGDICPNEEIKSITVMNAPALAISNPQNKFSVCPGDTLKLLVTGDAITSYMWSTGATSPSILITEPLGYSVKVTTSAGCILEVSKSIGALPGPTVTATVDPPEINVGKSAQLSASGLDTYIWRPNNSVSDSTIANPVATPLQTTLYTVRGRDINGCRGKASIQLVVLGSSAINSIFPGNFISPNDDNINNFWLVENIERFPECAVYVYSDKGSKVFEAKPYQNNWDGTFHGGKLPTGVYYYVVRCDAETKTKTGSIMLVR